MGERDGDDLSAVLGQWLAEVSAEAAQTDLREDESPDPVDIGESLS